MYNKKNQNLKNPQKQNRKWLKSLWKNSTNNKTQLTQAPMNKAENNLLNIIELFSWKLKQTVRLLI